MAIFYSSSQASDQQQKPYIASEAFERMKQLVGLWEGKMDMGKGPETITARYKLTSGGNAITETVFEGAPHEMVSVYHDNSDRKLTMTHYCMERNQPKMELTRRENKKLILNLAIDADIDVANETHMNAITIHFDGKDKMSQEGTQFEGEQKKEVALISYTRIK